MDCNRRQFFNRVAATGGALGIGVHLNREAFAATTTAVAGPARRAASYNVRLDAARMAMQREMPVHLVNGDEELYASRIGNFSKGLPHDQFGEVRPGAYASLIRALQSGEPADFEGIPLGGTRRLVNPQAGLAFDLQGADSHHLGLPPAPALASREAAAELVELYWMALARDVHFSDYADDATTTTAAEELSRLPGFTGPRQGGVVTASTLFRGVTGGDLTGPYLSQFLWMDIPMGAVRIPQRMQTAAPGLDYMMDYASWLQMQDGFHPGLPQFDAQPRYIRNLRDLAEWVHVDALYQAYHQACLILLGLNAPVDPGNPYAQSVCQDGFGTFGPPHVLSLVTEVATRALKGVWYQKWFLHRRLRPEAMGGLVDHTRTQRRQYPVHSDVLDSSVVGHVASRTGTHLLPMAFPEGSPLHPSYGAGHATVAGACVTILKAWFDESWVLPEPVVPDASGLSLGPYQGLDLTVGGELNKLAANVAIGRNGAGIHYRSEYLESIRLGESVALSVLEEQKLTYNEPVTLTVTKFDGTSVSI